MIVLLESKSIKGMVHTGIDATSISLNDAKAFPHWKLKDGPSITGIKENSTSKTTTNPVNWKDLDGNQGHFCPIVSDTPCTPWGPDLLETMGTVLTTDDQAFYKDIMTQDITG